RGGGRAPGGPGGATVKGVFLVARERAAVADALVRPEPPPGGVVLRVRGGGICGGDLKTYRSYAGPFPRFMGGHEYAGEVVRVGAGIAAFRVGDTAVLCF